MHVEVWYDYLCPWCYLAQDRVRYLTDAHGATVDWQPFELHPEIPADGAEIRGRPGTGEVIRRLAAEAGLPLGSRRRSSNTRRALGLSSWAADDPAWPTLHRDLFTAYWVDGADLDDEPTLVDIATRAGLDRGAAADAVATGAGIGEVHASRARALDLGIGATPGWHFGDGVVFSGVHDDAVMDRIVRRQY